MDQKNAPSPSDAPPDPASPADPLMLDHDVELVQVRDYQFRARFVNEGVELQMDESAPLGAGAGPEGVTLLAGAMGYCMTASLLFACNKFRLTVTGLRTFAKAELKRLPNRVRRVKCAGIDIHIDLSPGANDNAEQTRRRFERVLGLFGEYCVVTESVRGRFPVHVHVHHPWGLFERVIPVDGDLSDPEGPGDGAGPVPDGCGRESTDS